MLLRRSGTLSRGQGIEVGDGRDESREFGRPHILLRLRVGLVVEEMGVDRGFQIYGPGISDIWRGSRRETWNTL